MSVAAAAPAKLVRLDNYIPVVGEAEVAEIRALGERLTGRTVQMVNSTSVGGGVAEILNRVIPLLEELGLAVRWDVITGGDDFFAVTKGFHNALHGGAWEMPPESFNVFLAYNEQNRARMRFDSEVVIIHDPQPIALINAREAQSGHWIWRCHIDLSHPNETVWKFLEPFVRRYDCALFSSPEFSRQLPI